MLRREFLGLLSLIGCNEDMFLAQHGYLGGLQGNYFIVGIAGDSNAAGRALNEGPTAGTGVCFEFVSGNLVALTTNDLSTSIVGADTYGTYAKQFAIDHHARTGESVVFVAGGVASSTMRADGNTNNWEASPTGVNYDAFTTKMDACLLALGRTNPDLIIWSLGVNDIAGAQTAANIKSSFDSLLARIGTKYPSTINLWNQIGRNAAGVNGSKYYDLRSNLTLSIDPFSQHFMCGSGLSYVFTTGLEADNIHYNNASQNWYGASCDRFLSLHAISNKWSRGFLASHYTVQTPAVIAAVDDLVSTLYASSNYFTSESLFFYCADHMYNAQIDVFFMSAMTSVNGALTADQYIRLNGTSAYLATSLDPGNFSRALSTDNIHLLKVLDNRTAGTTACFLTCCNVSTPFTSMSQSAINSIIYRNNDGTVSTTAAIAAFQDNKFYGVFRSGTTKGFIEDTTTLASVVQALSGVPSGNNFHDGALANATFFMNCDLQARYCGKYTVLDISVLETKIQAVIDAH